MYQIIKRAEARQLARSINRHALTLVVSRLEDLEALTREELIDLEVNVRQAARKIPVSAVRAALDAVDEDVPPDEDEEIPAPPETPVTVTLYFADDTELVVANVDSLQVSLRDGSIPFGYGALDEDGPRKPLWYDNEGIAHVFDDRKAQRKGW